MKVFKRHTHMDYIKEIVPKIDIVNTAMHDVQSEAPEA